MSMFFIRHYAQCNKVFQKFFIAFVFVQQMGCFDGDDQTKPDTFSRRNRGRRWQRKAAGATRQRFDSVVGLLQSPRWTGKGERIIYKII